MAELECQEHIQRTHTMPVAKSSFAMRRLIWRCSCGNGGGGIVVHECNYDENDARRQDIEIYYSFVGKIDLSEA